MATRKRFPAAVLSAAYFLVQVVFLYAPETAAAENTQWKTRPREILLASLPGPMAAAPPPAAGQNSGLPAWLQILPSQGEVQRVMATPGARRWAVVLQDLHGQEEAQRNSAQILAHLSGAFEAAAKKPLFIGLEGAEGPFDFSPYRTAISAEVVRKTADIFLSQGLIAGPQAFGLTGTSAVFQGMENGADYLANVAALREARKLQPDLSRRLAARLAAWQEKAGRVFPAPLRRIEEASRQFHAGRLGTAPYLETLSAAAPLGEAAGQLLALSRREKTLDFAALERDRESVLTRLLARLSPAEREEIPRAAAACRAGGLSPAAFYRHIQSLCRRHGVDLAKNLGEYFDYLAAAEALDREALLADVEKAEGAAAESFFAAPGVKTCWEEGESLRLLERLAALELTPREWDRYRALRPGGPPENLAPFEEFYRLALKRNAAMAAAPQGDGAVLVAGGFHTAGLSARLRRAGWNVLVMSPKISAIKENDYLALFAVDRSPLDRVQAGEKLFLVYPPLLGATKPLRGFEEAKTKLDLHWNQATGGGTHASDFLSALKLDEASVTGEESLNNGLTLRRIRVPLPGNGLPQGTAILYRELGPTQDFALLVDKDSRVLAIFPDPGTGRAPKDWKFFDLSAFHVELPQKFGPEAKSAWREASLEARRLAQMVKDFRRERPAFGAIPPSIHHTNHAYMEWGPGGLARLAHFDLAKGYFGGIPRRAFRGPDRPRAVLALPPTVYEPRARGSMDQPYIHLLEDRIYARAQKKRPLNRLLLGGVGSGFDTVLTAWAVTATGAKPEIFGFDINPIALAAALRNAASAGIRVVGRVFDNLVSGTEPVFGGNFDFIAWNMPSAAVQTPEIQDPLSLSGQWDSEASPDTLDRFLEALPGLLSPGGEAVIWHTMPPEDMAAAASAAGLRIIDKETMLGDATNPIMTFAYALCRAADAPAVTPRASWIGAFADRLGLRGKPVLPAVGGRRAQQGSSPIDMLVFAAVSVVIAFALTTGHWAPIVLLTVLGAAYGFRNMTWPTASATVPDLDKQDLRDAYTRYTTEKWELPKILRDLERLASRGLEELKRRPRPANGFAGIDLSPRQQDFLRALCELLVNLRPVPPDTAAAELNDMHHALQYHPVQTRALLAAFEARFNPKNGGTAPGLHFPDDPFAQAFFRDAASALDAMVKTNYFVEDSPAISFRLDPAKLVIGGINPFEDPARFPEKLPYLPYAVLFSRVNGAVGFHVRFGDIARGGVREKLAAKPTDFVTGILDEAYRLAAVQDEKNVTIPADGAKAVYCIYPKAAEVPAARGFMPWLLSLVGLHPRPAAAEEEGAAASAEGPQPADRVEPKPDVPAALGVMEGFLCLMRKDERVAYRGPAGQEDDFLLFGPDVGTALFAPLVKALGRVMGFRHLWRFHMTGDPFLGIPHDKNNLAPDRSTNHVTSLGVIECLRLALFELDGDRPESDVRLVVTGDPGGDVAGGAIFHAFRVFGKRTKVTAVLGYQAIAFDPEGLDNDELLRLQGDGSRQSGIEEYRSPDGRQVVYPIVKDKDGQRWVSFPPAAREKFNRLTERALIRAGQASEAEGNLRVLADRVHFLLRADALIPADVRTNMIRHESVPLLFDENQKPNYRIIVYGANIWAEKAANEALEQHGVLVVPDFLANSVGVEISALVENHFNFLFEMAEMTEAVKARFLGPVLESLRLLMGRKYWATRMAQHNDGKGFFVSTHSQRLSQEVIRLSRVLMASPALTTDALRDVDWLAPYFRPFIPPVVDDSRLFERDGSADPERKLLNAVYDRFLRKLAARGLAMNVVYNAGPEYVKNLHASTPLGEDHIVLAYARAAAETGPDGVHNGLWRKKDALLLNPSAEARDAAWAEVESDQQTAAKEFHEQPLAEVMGQTPENFIANSQSGPAQTRPEQWLWARLSKHLPAGAAQSRKLEAAFTATLAMVGILGPIYGLFRAAGPHTFPAMTDGGSLLDITHAALGAWGPAAVLAIVGIQSIYYFLHSKDRRTPATLMVGAVLATVYSLSAATALWLPNGAWTAVAFAGAGWLFHFVFDVRRLASPTVSDNVRNALRRLSGGYFRAKYGYVLPIEQESRAALGRFDPVTIGWRAPPKADPSRLILKELLTRKPPSPLSRIGAWWGRQPLSESPRAYRQVEHRIAYWSSEWLAETHTPQIATAATLRALVALQGAQGLAPSRKRLAQLLPWILLGQATKSYFPAPASPAEDSIHVEDVSLLLHFSATDSQNAPWRRRLVARLRTAATAQTPVVLVADQGTAAEIIQKTALLLQVPAKNLHALPPGDYANLGQINLRGVAHSIGERLPSLKHRPLSVFTDDPSRLADLADFVLAQLTITFMDGREVRLMKDLLDRFRAQMDIEISA